MTRVSFDLTRAQAKLVQPLFDELIKLNEVAFAEGKEHSGAAIAGQLFWYDDHDTQTAEFFFLDPETAKQMYELLKRRKEERQQEA